MKSYALFSKAELYKNSGLKPRKKQPGAPVIDITQIKDQS
jgi:hypothetical protein